MKSFYSNRSKLVFLLPGFILFTLFVIYSIIPCFIMSLQNHNGAASLGWVGFDNYIKLLNAQKMGEHEAEIEKIKNVFLAILRDIKLSIDDVTAMVAGQIGQLAPMDEEAADLFQKLAKKMMEQTRK